MLQNLGKTIRSLRKHKGITLNEFANQLNVSPGYLSNLETAKTDTITFSLLEQLQKELNLFPALTQETDSSPHELHFRLQRLFQMIQQVHDTNPELANYFISHLEKGLQLYQEK
ncbi:helix-turn-helix domain-containing protein [Bacillus cereus]|uniref:helix-turn-helix domain-containing protein n=1 Tax=Bacillus cereus TaxID=1396 RepID=UPI000B4AB811|nr:helix-turn-helix transcriptional regulator [Bacillus cereus]